MDIIGIGELIVDEIKEKDECNPGGAPFNVICTCAKYGLSSTFSGRIGNDQYGSIILKTFNDFNIDKSNLIINDETTLHTEVTIKNGDRSFKFIKESNDYVTINPFIEANYRFFHFSSFVLMNRNPKKILMEQLNKYMNSPNKPIISFDGNYRKNIMTKQFFIYMMKEIIPFVNILKLSIEEAKLFTQLTKIKDVISQLSSYKDTLFLLSMGSKGAYLILNDLIIKEKAPIVQAIDTTGAGDILLGTFISILAKHLNNKDLSSIDKTTYQDILRISIANASNSTLIYGGIPSIPDLF